MKSKGISSGDKRLGAISGLVVLTAVLAVALVLVAGAVGFAAHWWRSPLAVAEPATLRVASGGTASSLAAQLQRTGLIDHPRLLSWILRLKGDAKRLRAGEYAVAPGDTLAELMARIVQGAVVSHAFRILEGSRIAEVLAALQAEPRLRRTLDKDHPQTLLADLGLDVGTRPHGEGWFFPDTYHFSRDDEDRALLLRAHARMLAELDSVWARRAARLPYQTPYEVLIAASLIEKETSRAEDRAHVSQVLAARLRRNMRLQVDPAVIYGLGDAYDRNLTRADLRRPTPYNTYVHKGLPPTPIALPGRAALQAAVHPSGAPYLYFVARGDGSSHFSETLEEHNAAVRKYQLGRP